MDVTEDRVTVKNVLWKMSLDEMSSIFRPFVYIYIYIHERTKKWRTFSKGHSRLNSLIAIDTK